MGAVFGILNIVKIKINIIIVLFIILVSSFIMIKQKKRYLIIIFNKKSIFIFTISVLIFSFYTLKINKTYENFYKNINIEIEMDATIISEKQESKYYYSYIIKGKNNIFKNKKFILYTSKTNNLEYGDKISIKGTFYMPSGVRNYKGFNYKQYLKSNKIYGSIKSSNVKIICKDNINFLLKMNNKARNKIITQTEKILLDKTKGILIALLLGNKTYIEEEIIGNFQKSSLAHILAISGTHLSYIILGINYIIHASKTPKKAGYFLTIFILIIFIFITNFSISVIRAVIMAIILIISKIAYRKIDIKNAVAISGLTLLTINPYCITNLSFELSYLGTIGVIFITPAICKWICQINRIKGKEKIVKILSVPISAQIAILPIAIINFNTISVTFLISNIIAIPLLGIIIVGGYIVILISFLFFKLAINMGKILNISINLLILISKIFSKSQLYIKTPNLITVIVYYFLIIGSLYLFRLKEYPKKIYKNIEKINYKKIVLIVLAIIVIMEIPYTHYNGKLKIYFVDVSQRR